MATSTIPQGLGGANAIIARIGATGGTFSLSNTYRGLLAIIDTTQSFCGLYFLGTTGGGTVRLFPIVAQTGGNITTSVANQISLSFSATCTVMLLTLLGTATY